jgi:transposase
MQLNGEYKKEFNELAYRLGWIGNHGLEQIAFFFNVSIETLNEWVLKYPEFDNSIKRGWGDHPSYLEEKKLKSQKKAVRRKTPEARAKQNEYIKKRMKEHPRIKIRNAVSNGIRGRFKRRNAIKDPGVFFYLGYSSEELCAHLEKQFRDGMTWENYGKVWHIDHIKPDKLFNYSSVKDQEFRQCWSLSNLQPLFVEENLKKGSRYASPQEQ